MYVSAEVLTQATGWVSPEQDRSHTVGLHLREMSRIGNLRQREQLSSCLGLGSRGEGNRKLTPMSRGFSSVGKESSDCGDGHKTEDSENTALYTLTQELAGMLTISQ